MHRRSVSPIGATVETMMKRRKAAAIATATVVGVLTAVPASACELIHLKRIRGPLGTPVVPPPGPQLCWTGCPLKIEHEQDPGKGRWILKKEDGDNSVQGVWSIETNLDTGTTFVMATERSDRTCPEPIEVTAARAAGAIDMGTDIGCSTPQFKVKFVKPHVCVDQTLNCASANQRSTKVFHDWDAIDDLGRGVPVVRDGITFTHSKGRDLSVYFEECCGTVADYGSPGDPFELDTYSVLRRPDGSCFTRALREGGRNAGDPLPDPAAPDTCG